MNIYDEAIIKVLYGNEQQKEFIVKALERAKKVEELLMLYRNLSMETNVDERMNFWDIIDKLEKNVFEIFSNLEKELEEMK